MNLGDDVSMRKRRLVSIGEKVWVGIRLENIQRDKELPGSR